MLSFIASFNEVICISGELAASPVCMLTYIIIYNILYGGCASFIIIATSFFAYISQSIQALLDCGCDVTYTDNEGLTAAELADKCDQTEAADLIRGEVTLAELGITYLEVRINDVRCSVPVCIMAAR